MHTFESFWTLDDIYNMITISAESQRKISINDISSYNRDVADYYLTTSDKQNKQKKYYKTLNNMTG